MKHIRALIAPVLLFVAVVSGYGFLFVNISRDVSAAFADRASAAALGQEESLQKTVQQFVTDTAAERTELASYVATDGDVVTLIQEIESVAGRDNVSLSVGAIAAVPSDWHYHEPLDVSLSASGSFSALAAFAADLESLPQASRLSSITFEASRGGGWTATCTVEFLKEKTLSAS